MKKMKTSLKTFPSHRNFDNTPAFILAMCKWKRDFEAELKALKSNRNDLIDSFIEEVFGE